MTPLPQPTIETNSSTSDRNRSARPGGPGTHDECPTGWDWRALARCGEANPDDFFSDQGDGTRNAVQICHACRVRISCLEWALGQREPLGVWGGLSEAERAGVLAERRKLDGRRWIRRHHWDAQASDRA